MSYTMDQIRDGAVDPRDLSQEELAKLWNQVGNNDKSLIEVLLRYYSSAGASFPSSGMPARTTTTRSVDYTIPAGFRSATITWLGGGTGTLVVDGIPHDATTQGSVEFSEVESGSDIIITANGNTYYTTVVA